MKLLKLIETALTPGVENIRTQYFALKDNLKLNREEKRMNKCIKEAVKRSKAKRKTYYVLNDWNGKPYVANRKELELMQKSGLFKHKLTVYDLMKEALFIARGMNADVKKKKVA